MKKRIALLLLSVFLLNPAVMAAPVFEGHAEKSEQYKELEKDLFTGEVEHLERKDVIHMTVSQVLDGSINMEGDEFFAEVVNDVSGDKGVIIPKGTIAHGKITQSSDAKRLGVLPGWHWTLIILLPLTAAKFLLKAKCQQNFTQWLRLPKLWRKMWVILLQAVLLAAF